MKFYIVKSAGTIPNLEQKVNKAIDEGFMPHGGAIKRGKKIHQPMLKQTAIDATDAYNDYQEDRITEKRKSRQSPK